MKDEQRETIIEAKDLHIHYTVRKKGKKEAATGDSGIVKAIDGVNLSIRKGEILAAVGESGCGKTTLGKALLNVVNPTKGEVLYNGSSLSQVSRKEMQRLRQKLQMVFQDPYESLDPRQSVYKTMQEPLLIHRQDLKEEEQRAMIYQYLEAVGLRPAESIAQRFPHHLSGGQRQRLSIAATMILEPDFIVADEPVSMLDVSVRAEILKLMLDIKGSKELTYLFITHDLSLAWMISDRIAVFYLGRMVEIGPAEDVVHKCLHPYSQALVSVIPTMEPDKKAQKQYVLRGETPSPLDVPKGCRFHTRCWYYQAHGGPSICQEQEPDLTLAGGEHYVACHFATQKGN